MASILAANKSVVAAAFFIHSEVVTVPANSRAPTKINRFFMIFEIYPLLGIGSDGLFIYNLIFTCFSVGRYSLDSDIVLLVFKIV